MIANAELNFSGRWPLAGQGARRARRVSCLSFRRTNERGSYNRRSLDGADSTRATCVAWSPRQPERRRERSRQGHPQRGWFRQPADRLNPVGVASFADRSVVNADLPIQKLTDKWHGRREFKRILGVSQNTYATEGPWEHWRTEARERAAKGMG